MSARLRWAVVVAAGLGSLAVWVSGVPADAGTRGYALRALPLLALQLAAVALVWRSRERAGVWAIVAFALAFRVAAVTWPPVLSSDLHRYVWDARVQAAGVSPYGQPPDAASLSHLRDAEVWPNINRPEAVTVYPPGAQLAFLSLAIVGADSVTGVKLAALAAELVALGLIALALRRRGWLTAGRLALYAWSPLVVAEVCVSGHIDALVLPLAVGALLLADARRGHWAGALIGFAATLKLYPILLLFALPRAARRGATAVALATVALVYLPYAAVAGRSVLGFLPDYVRTGEDFNMSLRWFVQHALAPISAHARPAAMAVCAVAFAAVLAWVWRQRDRWTESFAPAAVIAVAFILFLPTAVHPWYAMWLAPLLPLCPVPAAVWIIGMLPLSYLKYATADGHMPMWILWIEWLPAVALLVGEWMRGRRAQPEIS